MPAGLTSAEVSLLGLQTAAFSLCPHTAFLSACWGTEKKQTLWGLFRKDTNPFVRAPSSGPHLKRKYLPQAPFPNTIVLGVRTSTYGLGGGGRHTATVKSKDVPSQPSAPRPYLGCA